jgi:hypothetical protein
MTKAGAESVEDISATRLSRGDPWAFRPILANGLVLSFIHVFCQPSHFIHFTPKRKRSIREVRIEPLQELQDREVPPLGARLRGARQLRTVQRRVNGGIGTGDR